MRRIGRILFVILFLLIVGSTAYPAETPTPDEMVTTFFKTLQSGAIEKAYRALFESNKLAKAKEQSIQTIIAQTNAAFTLYGKITGWEKADEKAYGQSLKRMRYVMNTTECPIAWELYFWKSNGQWSVNAVRFMDQVQSIFD